MSVLPALHAQTDYDDDAEVIEVSDESETDLTPKVVLNKYKMGNGLRFTTQGGNKLAVSGLIQSSFQTTKYEGVDRYYTRFRIRRARLSFDGTAFHDRLRFRLRLDLVKGSETDNSDDGSFLQDAFVAYRPWGNNKLSIAFGQRATPTDNLELLMSSHTLQFGDRSKVTSAFSTIREVGVFADMSYNVGSQGVLRPSVAITDGSGPVSKGKRYGGLKYGTRVNYLPFGTFRSMGGSREGDAAYELTLKVSLGVAYSYSDGTTDRRGGRDNGKYLYYNDKDKLDLPDYSKLAADILFKYRGFSFLGEYVHTWAYVPKTITQRQRENGTLATTFEIDGRQDVDAYIKNRMMLGQGFNLQAGYMLRSLWSFDIRYTHLCPDKYSYLNNNLYFNRHNFYDVSVSKYLTRNYAAKVQLTVGLIRSAGENRTPDSQFTYRGNEWVGNIMFQFKI